jgi:hypothetical protein
VQLEALEDRPCVMESAEESTANDNVMEPAENGAHSRSSVVTDISWASEYSLIIINMYFYSSFLILLGII